MAKPKRKPGALRKRKRTMMTRAYTRAPSTVDVEAARFTVIAATETPVRTYAGDPRVSGLWIEADEILELSGLDLSRAAGMPFVDGHDVYGGIGKILGKVENVRVEGNEILADIELNSRNKDLIGDISRGHYAQVSIGYDYDAPVDAELEEREGDVPVVRVKRWTLTEISAVPIGADPNASVRAKLARASARTQHQETDMDEIEELVEVAEAALSALDEAVEAAGDDVSEELRARVRKLRELEDEDKDEDRSKRKRDPEEDDDENRGKREGDLTEEEEKAEEEEIRAIRSIAASYGPKLTRQVDDLAKLGARARQIKAAVRAAILGNGVAQASPTAVKPSGKRSAPVIDTDAIYARHNKR